MTQTTLTADIIAKEALAILDNELGWLGKIHRGYEDEFSQSVNGYKVGDTISIRRPADFTVRTTSTMNLQDVIEGKVTLQIAQQRGVDFSFSSTDLTLKIEDLSERVIRPATINLINNVAADVIDVAYKGLYNWVGTPSTTAFINSFADFAKGPERLDLMAVPQEGRLAILSPQDYWGFIGSQTALFVSDIARDAIRKGELGMIGNVDTYMSQVTPYHTNGTADDSTPIVKATGTNNYVYDDVKNTWSQDLVTTGWDTAATITAGTVFTIADVYMVNPKTKVRTNVLQQFVVLTSVTANVTTTSDTTLSISPPIIFTGPHQTVELSTGTLASNAIVPLGAASAVFVNNIVMHKNAMALAVVPMEMPQGAVNGSRRSRNGLSIRVIPIYDGINDVSKWRMDILYGRRMIDPRLGTRLSQS